MKKKVELKVKTVVPNLTDSERARRIEHFFDTLALVTKEPNYLGCKYDTETNTLIEYVSE